MQVVDPADIAIYIIGWMVFAPALAAIGVATYYRNRYRDGIKWQNFFDKGLTK